MKHDLQIIKLKNIHMIRMKLKLQSVMKQHNCRTKNFVFILLVIVRKLSILIKIILFFMECLFSNFNYNLIIIRFNDYFNNKNLFITMRSSTCCRRGILPHHFIPLTAFKASTRHMQKNLFENDKRRMFYKVQMEFGLYSDQV